MSSEMEAILILWNSLNHFAFELTEVSTIPQKTLNMTLNQKTTRKHVHHFLRMSLFVLLGSEFGVGVCDADVELLGALHDRLPFLRGDGVGDLRRVHAVLHQQHFQVRHIVDEEFLKSIGADVLGLPITTITNRWHFILSLESATHAIVDTLWLPPVLLHTKKLVGLMPDELFRSLLHNLRVIQRAHHLFCLCKMLT
jgi:hypothetical protein